MDLIAHRGFAARHPENTVAAVRRAARVADAVEVDVRRCGSGELVAIHDGRVDRVTDGEGRVADLSLVELRGLSVEGSGEPVPTLAEVLDAVPAGVAVTLELKERGLAAGVVRLARDVPNEVLVSSFDAVALEGARQADRSVPRAMLVRDGPPAGIAPDAGIRDAVAVADEFGCAAVHPHHRLCAPAGVERAHAAGMRVDAWTVRDGVTADRLADAGVDGLIADAPDVIG